MYLKTSQRQMSESFWTIAFLTVSGGLQDSYSYFVRGKVFANAQTGNLVFLASGLADGDIGKVIHYLLPLCSYLLGIYLTAQFKQRYKHQKIHWRQWILMMEILILSVTPFIPWDLMANCLISLSCAMQVQAFRKLHGKPFASTMCMGNMRSLMEQLSHYQSTKNPAHLKSAKDYGGVILLFVLGALIGYLLAGVMGRQAILICDVLLSIALIMMFLHHERHLWKLELPDEMK